MKHFVKLFFTLLVSVASCSDYVSPSQDRVLTRQEKDFIKSNIVYNYVGYSFMKQNGFNKKMIDEADTVSDLFNLLDHYVDDRHFFIKIGNLKFRQGLKYTPEIERSRDKLKTFNRIETNNTYYIRFNSSQPDWEPYKNFPTYAEEAKEKSFIVLDARSNSGGDYHAILNFFKKLEKSKYKGKIVILQDSYSCSAGEIWAYVDMSCNNIDIQTPYRCKLDLLLVGTYSGGMSEWGYNKSYTSGDITITLARVHWKMDKEKWQGEGKGFKPDIYTTDYKITLESLGCDMSEIEFQ